LNIWQVDAEWLLNKSNGKGEERKSLAESHLIIRDRLFEKVVETEAECRIYEWKRVVLDR